MNKHEIFSEAHENWNLKLLYRDLATTKGKPLTPMEKTHLRGVLLEYSPTEIAEKLQKQASGVETDLAATIYRYVKELVGLSNSKLGSWREVASLLETAGYKTLSPLDLDELNPDASVVNITTTNISNNIENNKLICLIRLAISVEIPKKSSHGSPDQD
jgi:hypothetical protein